MENLKLNSRTILWMIVLMLINCKVLYAQPGPMVHDIYNQLPCSINITYTTYDMAGSPCNLQINIPVAIPANTHYYVNFACGNGGFSDVKIDLNSIGAAPVTGISVSSGTIGMPGSPIYLGNMPSNTNCIAANTVFQMLWTGPGTVIQLPPPSYVGNYCAGSPNGLTSNYNVPLNNFNYNFTNPSNSSSQVLIGKSSCGSGLAKLDVLDETIGNGIYANCYTSSADNIAIRGNAGDAISNTANNIFGVLGEANLSNTNFSGNAAGVAGFCGPMTSGFMPPGQNIGVYGNSIANGGAWAGYFDGDVRVNGMVWGSQFGWVSDKRFKSNITELGSVTELLKKMKGYTYLFKSEEFKSRNLPKTEQIGFIAQELKEVFPQLVFEDKQGFMGVNYVGFIPVLLEAHQEQQTKIEEQEQAIKNQQQQIDELKAMLQSITGTSGNKTGKAANLSVTLGDENVVVLNQNVPNPFAESTVITFNIPSEVQRAEIIFSTSDGVVIRKVSISERGRGSLNVFANDLSHGMYTYTLFVEGKAVETKQMLKE